MADKSAKKLYEERMEQREAQNLSDPNAVPEQRPIASQDPGDQHSRVYKQLKDAGDPRANDEPMGHEAYEKASSDAQMKKAEKESRTVERMYPGARVWINNENSPDHGRAAAVNRVVSWKSVEDQLVANTGGPDAAFAEPLEYEVMTRDGRAEMLIVNAEHLRRATTEADWGKTSIT